MSRVAIDLNFIQIYWYSIFILIGMMIGMYLVYSETKKKKISENLVTNLIFYTVIIAIFGARIYYVLFNWDYYSKNFLEIFELWNGGLAIHGGIIFGGLFLIYYTKAHKLDTLKVLDICSVGLIIGQAFGRWGNFFNQEAYGAEVSLEFLKGLHLPDFIIDGMHINGTYWHPTFLYESLWCLIGFVILLIIRRRKYIKTGQIFAIYCMWYGFERFFIEALRTDSLMLGPIKAAQVVSIGMFLVGVFFFVRRLRCPRFDHLYNDADVVVEKEEKEDKKYYGLFKNYNDDGSYKNKKEEQNNNSNINSGVIVGNTSSNVESGGVMNLNMNVETPSNPEPVQSKTFIDTGASQSNQLVNNNNFPNMNTQPVINNNVDYNNTNVNNGMNNNNFVNNNVNNNVNTNVNNPFINNGNNNNM